MVAAKKIGMGGNYLHIFILATVAVIFGGAMLIAGYMLGYLYLKHIWIIAAKYQRLVQGLVLS